MKHLKYFLIIFILLLSPNVFADEINISSKVRSSYNGTGGTYLGLENYNYGQSSSYSIGTRYNGRLSKIDFFLNSSDWNWNYNSTYTVTLNMATEDWRNQFMQIQAFMTNDSGVVSNSYNNLYVANSFRFVSYKKIKFDIRTVDVMLSKIKFTLWSGSNSFYFTGVNNWNLSSITISDQVTVLPTPIPNQPTPTPIPDSSQAIIDNQTQNTQDIINNNNQNTADIIENNNQNTVNIITDLDDIFKNCHDSKNLINQNNLVVGWLNSSNGVVSSGGSSKSTNNIISLTSGTTYTISGGSLERICYYNNSSFVSCASTTTTTFTIPNNANGVRFQFNSNYLHDLMLNQGTSALPYEEYGVKSCTNKIEDTTNAINRQTDYLMDNSDPNISNNEFTSLFDSVSFNDPLSSLLQLPVQFINAIVNQSNSCQVVNLGTLLGIPITLPCIDIGSILGNSVWSTIDILSSIGLIVLILKQLYDSVINALTLGGYMEAKKGGLGYMTPLEYLCFVITGGGGDI